MKQAHAANYISGFAHQLWLAGLGMLAVVQKEGGNLFDELVKEGKHVENRRVNKDSLAAAVVSTKVAYQKKMEAQLKEWDGQLDQLMARAAKMKTDARGKVEAEIDGLKARRATAQKKLDELRQRGEDAWVDLKDGAEQIWNDINQALGKALAHFK